MYKLGLEKAEEPEIKLLTFTGSQRSQGNSRKAHTSAPSLTMLDYMKAYYCVDHSKLENSSRDGNIRSPYLFS